jgi:uncharacterized repeat protein (TIGR01451 family)
MGDRGRRQPWHGYRTRHHLGTGFLARTVAVTLLAATNVAFLGTGFGAAAGLSTQVATATQPMADAPGTATTAVAPCASGALVGGGIELGRVSDTATPNNGLKVNGSMPSDAAGNPATNGSTDPSDWAAIGGYGGQSESGDQVTAFALCATGGPTHTEVVTATVAGESTQGNLPLVATATCPTGSTLIGGGALGTPASEPSFKPIASYPSDVSGTAATDGTQGPTSWSAYGSAGQINTAIQVVTAFALCATNGGVSTTVARVDATGPQTGSTYTTSTVSCPSGTLLGGGFAVDGAGTQPQQGVHLRGSYPSDATGAPAGDGSANPTDWTAIVQAGGQNTPGTNVHVFALCGTVTPPPPSADVSLTKTASPNPATVGSPITYTLTAANAGPDSAAGVSVSDPLPSGVSFASASTSQGTCSQAAGTVSCALGSLAAGSHATVTVGVTPTATGTVTNTASVSATTADPNPANNSATVVVTVNPKATSADVSLTKTASPNPATVGSPITYTLTAANAGPDSAAGVSVSDPLPSGVSFASASTSQGTCSQAAGTVSCALGSLAAGSHATVTVGVTPTATGTVTNTASVSATTADPNPANNSATVVVTVNPKAVTPADVSITKTGPFLAIGPRAFAYTLKASNLGPGSATGVRVTDNLPGGISFASVTPTQGSCTHAGSLVTCSLGALAPGASATIILSVVPSGFGFVTNSAAVTADQPDPNTTNNTSHCRTLVLWLPFWL